MATWVQCEAYTEDRTKIWINLDWVAMMTPYENGTVLVLAVSDERGAIEHVVCDSVEKIIGKKHRA